MSLKNVGCDCMPAERLFISKSTIFARHYLEFTLFLKSFLNDRCVRCQLTQRFMRCLAIITKEIKINCFNVG
jgi:hypothetical protein